MSGISSERVSLLQSLGDTSVHSLNCVVLVAQQCLAHIASRGTLGVQGDDDVGTVPLSAMDFGHNLCGDLRGNNVMAAALAVALPHEARAHEVLILDV